MMNSLKMKIEIWSDVICPFCKSVNEILKPLWSSLQIKNILK